MANKLSNLLWPLISDHIQKRQTLFPHKEFVYKMGREWILSTPRKLMNLRRFKNFRYNKSVATTFSLYGKDPILGAEGKMQVPQTSCLPHRALQSGRDLVFTCRRNPEGPQVFKSLLLQISPQVPFTWHLQKKIQPCNSGARCLSSSPDLTKHQLCNFRLFTYFFFSSEPQFPHLQHMNKNQANLIELL